MGKPVDTSSQIDNILEQTEVGSFIAKYKTPVIAFVALLILGVVGFGIYKTQKSKQEQVYASAVYKFEKDVFTEFATKKIAAAEYFQKLDILRQDVKSFDGFFPLALKSADLFIENSNDEQAIKLLENLNKEISNPVMKLLLNSRLAVAYENAKAPRKAITVLEELIKNQTKIMESKIYLDLGRLYLAVGDKEKAKSNLQYTIDNTTDENLKKMAKAYLAEI